MATRTNIFSDEWCEMVFEDRNKLYGGYLLRKLSSRRHALSLIIAVVIFVLAVSSPSIIRSITPEKKEKDVTVRTLTDIKLDKPKEAVDEIVKALPPPPPLKNVIKFTAPVIKADEEVADEEQPKMQDEVVESKAAIGSMDYDKGTDDPNAEMPEVMPTQDQQIVEEKMEPYLVVEQMPDFPGGEAELYKYLEKNIKYPALARESGVTGTVYIKFVVNKDGKISNITILRGIGAGCDEEAVKVVGNMPSWKPGKQNGIAVPVWFTLPLKFTLK
jgi:periplasmic protein TonB